MLLNGMAPRQWMRLLYLRLSFIRRLFRACLAMWKVLQSGRWLKSLCGVCGNRLRGTCDPLWMLVVRSRLTWSACCRRCGLSGGESGCRSTRLARALCRWTIALLPSAGLTLLMSRRPLTRLMNLLTGAPFVTRRLGVRLRWRASRPGRLRAGVGI